MEISLQPWESFKPDGVILFSDILTPLPAFGLPFEIDDYKVGNGVHEQTSTVLLKSDVDIDLAYVLLFRVHSWTRLSLLRLI